jgi:hypothetical protein
VLKIFSKNMPLTLTQSVVMKPDILVQDLEGELVLLSLGSEEYFGLDDVGSAMWKALQDFNAIQLAYECLLEQYDVEPEQLQSDFLALIEKWQHHGLVEVVS